MKGSIASCRLLGVYSLEIAMIVDYLGFTRWRLCVITQFELASTCTSLSQGYCTLQYKAPPGLAPRKTAFRRTVTGGVINESIVVRAVTNS